MNWMNIPNWMALIEIFLQNCGEKILEFQMVKLTHFIAPQL